VNPVNDWIPVCTALPPRDILVTVTVENNGRRWTTRARRTSLDTVKPVTRALRASPEANTWAPYAEACAFDPGSHVVAWRAVCEPAPYVGAR
jgi:hypothetical protein